MKTHTIKTPTAEFMVVELPNGSYYEVFNHGIYIKDDDSERGFIKGSYTLLGKPDEIREEDAAQLIPMYFDHEKTAVEYLIEMIESEIYWNVNPIKKPNGEDYYYEENHGFDGVETLWDGGSYNEDLGIFEEAEQKTFNRNRSLIFKKKI